MSESRRLLPVVCAFLTASLVSACNGGDDPTSVIDDIRQAARDSSFLQLEQSVALNDLLPDITERSIEYIREDWSGAVSEEPDLDRWIDYSREGIQACVRGEVMDGESRRCDTVDQLFMFVGIRPNEFTRADVVDRTDSVATLRLQFENPRLDTTVALRVRAERQDEGWKIVGTENLSSVASRVQRRQRAILQAVNDSLRPKIREKVPTRSHLDRWREDARSSLYRIHLSAIVKNETDRPIDYLFVRVGDDLTNGSFRASEEDTIPLLAPGDSIDLHDTNDVVWSTICADYQATSDLCHLEDGASPEVEVESVRFEDGSWLGLHDDWYSYAFRNESEERRSEE